MIKFNFIDKRDIWLAVIAVVTLITFIPIFTYLYFAKDLTSKESIMNRNNTGFILTDRNDKPFFAFYEAYEKEFIPLSKIPKHTQQAVIAIEDREFYTHPGFSIRGIARSVVADIKNQEIVSGGSTITQQLVKNALLNPQRSFLRKYQEIVLAQEIERRFDKNEILEMYLNSVYFGEGAFGIQEAAQRYFSKNATDLTLAESTILAGVLPSPARYSPLNGQGDKAAQRQKLVLNAMVKEGYISQNQMDQVLSEKITLKPQKDDVNSLAPHFAIMVRDELIKRYGEEYISRSGFRVKTSIDLELQEYAESVVSQQVATLERNRVTNGAAVVMNPKNGEILAFVGSKDWSDESFGKVNIPLSLRQPGSSFKPIVYAAAMEKKIITAATPLKDQPTTYRFDGQEYKPENYDKKFRGTVLVRRSLANSLNVTSVEIMNKVGVNASIEFANRLGISTLKNPSNYGLSLVLGAGEVKLIELTNAYSVFANTGIKNTPTSILEIQDKTKSSIYKYIPNQEKVLEPEFAFIISSILSDNNARAEVFGNALTISRPAAVKTGTTENYRDAWTVGYTPSVTVGVWVGNNDGKPMDNIAGSLGAAPIWRLLMERAVRGTPVEQFRAPSTVVQRAVCQSNGLLTREATSSAVNEYFLRGTEPTQYCSLPVQPTPSTTVSPTASQQNPTQATTISPSPSNSNNNGNRENRGNNDEKDKNSIEIKIER